MTYVKQNWENLPSQLTPVSAERLNHLETQYDASVAFTKDFFESFGVFDVRDFGAKGDSVTDDTDSFQAAFNALIPLGGGKIIIPPGEYLLNGFVDILSSNVEVEGINCTLIKPPTGRSSVAFFAIRSFGRAGYGSGGENYLFRGITTLGQSQIGHSATLLSAHHARNVLILSCRGVKSVGRGHWVDLNGCDTVIVRDCFVSGAAITSDVPGEAIQADLSREGSMSVVEDDPAWYDGLPSRNVWVDSSSFVPYNSGGVSLPSPVAFGSHTSPEENLWFENMRFTNCYVGPTQGRSSGIRGAVHFISSKNVVITGNFFDGTGVAMPLVSIQAGYGSGNPEIDTYGVVISGNSFSGDVSTNVYLSAGTGVSVTGNSFQNLVEGYGVLVATDVIGFSISSNTFLSGGPGGATAIQANNAPANKGVVSGNMSEIPYSGAGFTSGRILATGNYPNVPT